MTTPNPPQADPAQGQPPADPTDAPPQTTPPTDPPKEETDWKAMARKWERLAKENSKAAEELEQVRSSSMSEQEKAVAEAEKRGRTAAALDSGKRLARAELKAAAASKGLDLSEIGDLISVDQFINDKGEVDETAIGKAVGKLAKATGKPAPPRGSGQFDGSPGQGQPVTEEQLARMSPEEKVAALEAGKLAHLL
jgi:hypothetical protein